ncbi:MAG: L,D-transpeptidase family protein [Coxiellaceae bacterium]|nr:L,D-transpeptidase family protein [Coxiellaceae bacterium]
MRKLFYFSAVTALLSGCAHTPTMTPSISLSMPPKPETSNKTALQIYEKLPTYAEAAKLPWQPLTKDSPDEIRARLIALHDLSPQDPSLVQGIKQFQLENDLPRTGVMDQNTVAALNITPAQRFNTLVKAMHQWEKFPENANSRYIQVNVPSYTLNLISQGEKIVTMRVIVGRPSRPTPTITSEITTIIFNPGWNVPKTILANDVIPGMRKNPNYMKEHYDMHIYKNWDKNSPEINPSAIDWQTANTSNFVYRVTAPPSDKNPLGRVKFSFANEHDVYMHDTPEKSLFALTDRARSSGCVRLEDSMALVRYFYADNNDLSEDLSQQYLSTYQTKYIQLRNAMPVYLTYILVTVDANGNVHFWKNIYGE